MLSSGLILSRGLRPLSNTGIFFARRFPIQHIKFNFRSMGVLVNAISEPNMKAEPITDPVGPEPPKKPKLKRKKNKVKNNPDIESKEKCSQEPSEENSTEKVQIPSATQKVENVNVERVYLSVEALTRSKESSTKTKQYLKKNPTPQVGSKSKPEEGVDLRKTVAPKTKSGPAPQKLPEFQKRKVMASKAGDDKDPLSFKKGIELDPKSMLFYSSIAVIHGIRNSKADKFLLELKQISERAWLKYGSTPKPNGSSSQDIIPGGGPIFDLLKFGKAQCGRDMQVLVYVHAIYLCGLNGWRKFANNIFQELERREVKPNGEVFAELMQVHLNVGDFPGCIATFEKFQKTCAVHGRPYSVLIEAYIKHKKFPKALEVIEIMKKQGVTIDEQYNLLTMAYIREKEYNFACQAFDLTVKDGRNPSSRVYSEMSAIGQSEEASLDKALLEKILARGIIPVKEDKEHHSAAPKTDSATRKKIPIPKTKSDFKNQDPVLEKKPAFEKQILIPETKPVSEKQDSALEIRSASENQSHKSRNTGKIIKSESLERARQRLRELSSNENARTLSAMLVTLFQKYTLSRFPESTEQSFQQTSVSLSASILDKPTPSNIEETISEAMWLEAHFLPKIERQDAKLALPVKEAFFRLFIRFNYFAEAVKYYNLHPDLESIPNVAYMLKLCTEFLKREEFVVFLKKLSTLLKPTALSSELDEFAKMEFKAQNSMDLNLESIIYQSVLDGSNRFDQLALGLTFIEQYAQWADLDYLVRSSSHRKFFYALNKFKNPDLVARVAKLDRSLFPENPAPSN